MTTVQGGPARPRTASGRRLLVAAALGALLVTAIVGPAPAPAGAVDSPGTDVWLAFGPNFSRGTTPHLLITGEDATGTVAFPGLGTTATFSTADGGLATVPVPRAAAHRDAGPGDHGIHVTADRPVTVHGVNRMTFSTDTFLALPTPALGTDHVAVGYEGFGSGRPGFALLVGTVDGTTVEVTPPPGQPAPAGTVALDAGATHLLTAADVTGTRLRSDEPIVVLSGAACANVPAGSASCDHLVEQVLPTDALGTRFLTVPFATRAGDVIRVVAAHDHTSVHVDGHRVAVLDAGEVYEQHLDAPAVITTGRPAAVAQYATSTLVDGAVGDPAMTLVPAVDRLLRRYTFAVPATGFAVNHVNVVVPDGAVEGLRLDGQPVDPGAFSPAAAAGWRVAQLPVAPGAHVLEGPARFAAIVHGFDEFDSYAHPAGLSTVATCDELGIASAPVHQHVEPTANSLAGSEIAALVHTVNCDIVVPLEAVVDRVVDEATSEAPAGVPGGVVEDGVLPLR